MGRDLQRYRAPPSVPAPYIPNPRRHLVEEVTRYDPKPTPPPEPDPELPHQPWPERLAGVAVYTWRRWEHALSPRGAIQAWLRICLRVAVVLLALLPAVVIAVIIVRLLVELVAQAVRFLIGLVEGIALLCGAVLLLRLLAALLRRKPRQQRR